MKLKKLTGNEPVTIQVEGYTENINQFNFNISGTLQDCLIMIDNACIHEHHVCSYPNYKKIIKTLKYNINHGTNNTFSCFTINTPFGILNLLD